MQVSKMLFEYNRLGYYNAEPKLPGRDQELFRRLFNPINELIRDNEQGVWYDPSDFSTMFQDAAGTTPVTAMEQPVGLILDKSKGLVLGPELVVNGDFSNGTTGWTNNAGIATTFESVIHEGVRCLRVVTPSINGGASQVALISGGRHTVSYRVKVVSGSIYLGISGNEIGGVRNTTNSGSWTTVTHPAYGATNPVLRVYALSAAEFYVTEISVRELPGNHAYQSTSASRPVLSALVNMLTYTEDFSHSDWAWGNKFTYEAASAPNGENTATKLTTAGDALAIRSFTAVATSFEYVIYLKTGAGLTPTAIVRNSTTALNLITVRTKDVSGSNQYGSWDVISLDGGWKKIKITVTGGISTGNGLVFYFGNTNLVPIGSYWYIWHPDIRPANTGTNLPDYQRVTTSTDYDTAGFPMYLRFDGVDDFLQTNSINFTTTDKMTVLAGVRKLSDAATATLFETSSSIINNNGTLFFGSPTSTNSYQFNSKGSSDSVAGSGNGVYVAPITNVVAGISDISGDSVILRVDGTQAASSTADQGTGNYGNYPLYIGRRGGTSLPFKGQLYGLVIRGALSDANQIANAERFMNSKTGAY